MLNRLGVSNKAVHTSGKIEEVQRAITESRLGTELWKLFLIAAILVAIIEMLIARDTKNSAIVSPIYMAL
jgi:hypothetical protein